MLLTGAFAGVIGTHALGHAGLGLVASVVGGALLAAVVAIAGSDDCADQIGLRPGGEDPGAGLDQLPASRTLRPRRGPDDPRHPLTPVPVPVLGDIPVVGPLLFRQPALTYVGLVLVVVMFVVLQRTRAGLTLRAVGENPAAAFASGANPIRVRFLAVIGAGALAGVGGAVLSLQQVGTFTDAMTNGRGYLALAAIIVGRWSPGGALAGCLLFGATDALQLRIQGLRLPSAPT